MVAAFQTGDIQAVLGEFHPECQVHEADSLPYPGTHTGLEGFTELLGSMHTSFDITLENSEIFDAGDTVVQRVQMTFISRKSGRKISMPVVEVYKFRDGKIIDADVYYKDAAAVGELAQDTGVDITQ
jgi:ketosteroid isomerase-like protein